MSAELNQNFNDIEIELFAEGKGIFDVKHDCELIYSKYETGRFPNTGEVSDIIRERS